MFRRNIFDWSSNLIPYNTLYRVHPELDPAYVNIWGQPSVGIAVITGTLGGAFVGAAMGSLITSHITSTIYPNDAAFKLLAFFTGGMVGALAGSFAGCMGGIAAETILASINYYRCPVREIPLVEIQVDPVTNYQTRDQFYFNCRAQLFAGQNPPNEGIANESIRLTS